MTGRIEAVIFDWAGTTVDYGCFAPVEALRQAFREVGIDPTAVTKCGGESYLLVKETKNE